MDEEAPLAAVAALEPTTEEPELTELDPALTADFALPLSAAALNFSDREASDDEAAAEAELREADPLASIDERPAFEDMELRDEAAAADAELRDADALVPSEAPPELTELAPALRPEEALLARAAALKPEDRELRDEDAAADAELSDADSLAPVEEAPIFEARELKDEDAAADAELRDADAAEPSDAEDADAYPPTDEEAESMDAEPWEAADAPLADYRALSDIGASQWPWLLTYCGRCRISHDGCYLCVEGRSAVVESRWLDVCWLKVGGEVLVVEGSW